jgi:hypothetical protein
MSAPIKWKAHGGYSRSNPDNTNQTRERLWLSPHCIAAAPSAQIAWDFLGER